MTSSVTTDVAVLGGGPAGAVAALGLHRLGYRVVLLSRSRPHVVLEGLSARTVGGLRSAGAERALACVGPAVPRRVTWNGDTRAADTEHLVDRSALDVALLEDARAAGVTVIAGRVGRVAADGEAWRISGGREGGEAFVLEAAFLVEARGREAPAPGRSDRGSPTTALLRAWTLPPGRPAGTAVAAFARGWVWLAATVDGRATLQLVVSGEPGRLPGRADLERFYDAGAAGVPEAVEWLAGASPAGPVLARHATPVLAAPLVGDRSIRVGDAAFATDPLSGQGVFEAVGGSLAAVAVVNTLLRRPVDRSLATEFYEARAAEAFRRHGRIGRDHYARERRWEAEPFWAVRRAWPGVEPAREAAVPGRAEILERPVIADGFVGRREVVVTPDHPRGVWQVAGVSLASLLEFLRERPPAPAAPTIAAAATWLSRREEEVATAFDWLRFRGLVY